MQNIFTKQTRGASTLTMQLASMLDDRLRPKSGPAHRPEMASDEKRTGELEKAWSKKEILEAYLNLITFRGELQGISASARGLFDKAPDGLNELESVILASFDTRPQRPGGCRSQKGLRARQLYGPPCCVSGYEDFGKRRSRPQIFNQAKGSSLRRMSHISYYPHILRQMPTGRPIHEKAYQWSPPSIAISRALPMMY